MFLLGLKTFRSAEATFRVEEWFENKEVLCQCIAFLPFFIQSKLTTFFCKAQRINISGFAAHVLQLLSYALVTWK